METRSAKNNKKRRGKKQTTEHEQPKIHFIRELEPKPKNCYTIKVGVIRKWKTYYMDAPSKANEINEAIWGAPVPCYNINMILMDEEGTKIHACANFYTIFKSKSEEPLKEGAQLIISGFNCVKNMASLKLTDHDAKIYFAKNTSVTPIDDFKNNDDGFDFVSFEEIIKNRVNKDIAFDVIGQIVSNKKLKQVTVDERQTSLIEYELQNTSGQKISCVLWEDDADSLQDYINKNITRSEPIVIIIQLAKINMWEGSQQVSSINKASKIYINNNHEHISSFKERLKMNISNGARGQPHVNLKTSYDEKPQTKEPKYNYKKERDMQKTNGYNEKIIIEVDDSEDEKPAKTQQKKRYRNNKHKEDAANEEKGTRTLKVNNKTIEISDDEEPPKRTITATSIDIYNEKQRNEVCVIDDEDD